MGKIFDYTISILTLGYFYFNRNPTRNIPEGTNIVSIADGTIVDIKNNRIEIFINLWDVHYQRAPFDGQITNIISQSPRYNVIELETKLGHFTVERWAGELARTIITYVKIGDIVTKGQVLGRILLGSHAAITIPPYLQIKVKPYQHIVAGETIIAE